MSYNPADFFIKILSQAENKLSATNSNTNSYIEHISNEEDIEYAGRTIDEFVLKQCQKYVYLSIGNISIEFYLENLYSNIFFI